MIALSPVTRAPCAIVIMPTRLYRGDFPQRPPSSALVGEAYPLSNDKLAAQLCACFYIAQRLKIKGRRLGNKTVAPTASASPYKSTRI